MERQNRTNQLKHNQKNKIAIIITHLSIITLNINDLDSVIKRQRLVE